MRASAAMFWKSFMTDVHQRAAVIVPWQAKFIRQNPDVMMSSRIYGGCHVISFLYATLARRSDVDVVYCIGHKRRYANRHRYWNDSGYPNPDPDFYHVMNRWRDFYIDWSYRQFVPGARIPFVFPIAAADRLWHRITDEDPTD